MLQASPPAHDAPLAPVSVWHVDAPVIVDLLLARELRVGRWLNDLDILIVSDGDLVNWFTDWFTFSSGAQCTFHILTTSETLGAPRCCIKLLWTYRSCT